MTRRALSRRVIVLASDSLRSIWRKKLVTFRSRFLIFWYLWQLKVTETKFHYFFILLQFGCCYLELWTIDILTFNRKPLVRHMRTNFSASIHSSTIWFSGHFWSSPGHALAWKQLEEFDSTHRNIKKVSKWETMKNTIYLMKLLPIHSSTIWFSRHLRSSLGHPPAWKKLEELDSAHPNV